jgi:hypothetical protein
MKKLVSVGASSRGVQRLFGVKEGIGESFDFPFIT